MAKNDLLIRIAADISSLDKATRAAVSKIQGMANDLNAVGSRLAIGITAPLAGLATVTLRAAGELDALRRGLDTVTGSSQETATQMARLRELAKLPGLGLPEAIRGSINLQTLGFSAKNAESIIREFGNALASVGRGREDLDEVIRQLGQMASRGKVTADNLKPIIERVPQAAAIIKREFGTIDTEVLQKMGVSADDFIRILRDGLGQLPRSTGGIKNDFQNLRDSIEQAAGAVGETLIPIAKRAIDTAIVPMLEKVQQLAKRFQELPGPVQDAAIGLGVFVAAIGPALLVIGQMTEGILALSKAYTALKASALLSGAGATLLRAAPWVALTAALGYTVSSLNNTKDAMDRVAKASERQRDAIHAVSADINLQKYGLIEARNGHDLLLTGILNHVDAMNESTAATSENAKSFDAVAAAAAKTEKAISKFAGMSKSILDSTMRSSIEDSTRELERMQDMSERAAETLEKGAGLAALSVEMLNGNLEASQYAIDRLTDPGMSDLVSGMNRAQQAAESLSEALQTATRINLSDSIKNSKMDAGIDAAADAIDRGTKRAGDSSERFSRQVSLVLNDVARDVTDLIFKGGKLKDVMMGTFENIGRALLRSAIESQLQRIMTLVTGLISKIPGLSKIAGAVFSGGTNAAGGAVSAAGSAAGSVGSVGSIGGIAGKAVGSGLSAAVGLAASIGTFASSVFGNFQNAAMNKSLDLIVNHTLRTANQLIEGLQPQVNRYLPYLEMIHQRMVEQIATGGNNLATAGGPVTINFYGSNGDYERFMRELKLRGVIR